MQESGNKAGKYSYNAAEIISRHAFAVALAVSLIWHVFWIGAARIFIASPSVPEKPSSVVSFMGPILENRAAFASKKDAGSPGRTAMMLLPGASEGIDAGDSKASFKRNSKLVNSSGPDVLEEMNIKSSVDPSIRIKEVPEKPFDKVKISYKTFPSEIEGPARLREVIYRPELPQSLNWDEGLGVDLDRLGNKFLIELKFTVSPEGKVYSVERISSSGHPTIDLIAMRYLKDWQFAPLKGGEGKEQQGTIKLEFSLKKAGLK